MISTLENHAGREVTFATLETSSRDYDQEAVRIEEMVAALETDLEAVKQKHLPGLKRQAAGVARREAELASLIESAPGLFIKPRTVTLHGVKIGYTVSNGKLMWDCEDATLLARIRQEFGRSAGQYIHTKETPNKDTLKDVEAATMKKLGLRIDGAGDIVILKRVAGDVEKLIDKLIEKLVEGMMNAV